MPQTAIQIEHNPRRKILEKWRSGLSVKEVAGSLGISEYQVRKVTGSAERISRKGMRVPPILAREIVLAYKHGHTQMSLAKRHNLSRDRVRTIIREAGVPANVKCFCPHCNEPIISLDN